MNVCINILKHISNLHELVVLKDEDSKEFAFHKMT